MKASDIGILIVDDEASVRDALHQWFEFDGYRVDSAADATIALQKLQDAPWDIVLLDIKMPGMDGLELQRRIKEIDKHIITIMITAFASVDTSIQALKEGAFDYIVKPVDPDDMAHLIRNAVEQRRLYYENRQLRSQLEELNTTDRIVGQSEQLKAVLDKVARVAPPVPLTVRRLQCTVRVLRGSRHPFPHTARLQCTILRGSRHSGATRSLPVRLHCTVLRGSRHSFPHSSLALYRSLVVPMSVTEGYDERIVGSS